MPSSLLSRDDVQRFVRSLQLPKDRAEILEAELMDHLECAMEAAGAEALREEDARAIAEGLLGPDAGRALQRVDGAFGFGYRQALLRGVAAALSFCGASIALAVLLEAPPLPGLWFQALGILLAPLILLFLPRGYSALIRGELRLARATPRRRFQPAMAFLGTFMVAPMPILLLTDLLFGLGDPAEALLVPVWLALLVHLWIAARRVHAEDRALARR
ncbi:MAG: hypothetical protein U1E65_14455 [Myxococcota bacterium]